MVGGTILIREFWVGALRDFNARNGNINATKVTFMAKIKTATQLFAVGSFLIALIFNNALIMFISNFLLFLALIISLQTGLSYTISTFKK
jgi:phosphatidylglycerophosphate synthase